MRERDWIGCCVRSPKKILAEKKGDAENWNTIVVNQVQEMHHAAFKHVTLWFFALNIKLKFIVYVCFECVYAKEGVREIELLHMYIYGSKPLSSVKCIEEEKRLSGHIGRSVCCANISSDDDKNIRIILMTTPTCRKRTMARWEKWLQ